MDIEQFVAQSEGKWRSMRSGHSLAFQQFEEVVSEIIIKKLLPDDQSVLDLISSSECGDVDPISPFQMDWNAESDWEPDDPAEVSSGSCILVPIAHNASSGKILRSVGYAEISQAVSEYSFLSDGTFLLTTKYEQAIAEERIWFVSEHLRCRSSVLRTSAGSGVLQTSFASEVRRLKS